jgi:hypothetical protein
MRFETTGKDSEPRHGLVLGVNNIGSSDVNGVVGFHIQTGKKRPADSSFTVVEFISGANADDNWGATDVGDSANVGKDSIVLRNVCQLLPKYGVTLV